MLAELHRQRQADVSEAHDAEATLTQVELHHDLQSFTCLFVGRSLLRPREPQTVAAARLRDDPQHQLVRL